MNIKQRGFSLLELLVVIGIISIIASISIPSFVGSQLEAGYVQEVKAIRDLISDARANAISGKQCDVAGDKEQSVEWALRFSRIGPNEDPEGDLSDYFMQLMCVPLSALDTDSDGDGNFLDDDDYLPQGAEGHSGVDLTRELSEGDTMTGVAIVVLDGIITDNEITFEGPGTSHTEVEDGFYSFNWVRLSFSEEGSQISIQTEGNSYASTEGGTVEEYKDSIYILPRHSEISKYNPDFSNLGVITNTHGICMNTHQGFPIYPCRLTLPSL